MKDFFVPQHGSIAHDETMHRVDFFHIKQEARQPQLISRLTQIRDHLNECFEFYFGQAV
jgi:hypothetical protein